MRERHNWAGKTHPSACTCAGCSARRLALPPVKKKNKPKSLRGKPKADPVADALDIFKDFGKGPEGSNALEHEDEGDKD